MEAVVVGSVIRATIQVVLQNMLLIPTEEFNLFRDFKKDLKKLKDSFLMIQDFLYDAEMQQETNKAINRWLKKLESVAFDADNVFDELNYHVLRNKIETDNNMAKKVRAFFTPSNPIAFRLKMAHKIKDINEKLKFINQKARDFGLQTRKPAGAGIDAAAPQETNSVAADKIVLGREDDVSSIVEKLTTPTEQVFSILPIVGMGGLGKTTLARQVFHNEKIKSHFDQQIWVHVSRSFDALTIFQKILESLTERKCELGAEVVLKKLKKDLEHKRYLLVLDDVWNEERESWDNFLNSLSGISSSTGNGMIVTTRSGNIASIVKTLPICELKGLSQDECWSIIKAKAFKEAEVPSDIETIGRNIAKRCQGLPLASKVVGGLLCDKSRDEWLTIEKDWLSNFGEDERTISKVLKFSFDHLSRPSLKKCFAYCSIFDKGAPIKRELLIELWMAEGFLTPDQSNDMEKVGNKFFDLLVQSSLLQVEERDSYGNVTYCNMHDLVHDLAISLSGSKNNCANDKSLEDIHRVRYTAESCPIPKEQARRVRTLFMVKKVSNNMFLDFKSLHTLILVGEDIEELPSLISELIHLRLVDISDTRIESLPDSIGKLYHLQTLCAGSQFVWVKNRLRKLPNTLKNLVSLRHLHVPNIELPSEIGRLTSLQTLHYFKIGNEKGCRIGELGRLKNLKGKLEIHNLERVDDKEEAMNADLFQKKNIFDLKFAWNISREGETNDENVLEGLQPHPNLKGLEIYGFRGRHFPSWTLKMEVHDDLQGWIGLSNLMEITLMDCYECEEIPMLGHLPCLKSLCLIGLTNVRSIGSSFYGTDNGSISSRVGKNKVILFPVLERLELIKMSILEEWAEPEIPSEAETQVHKMVVFPRLEYLRIRVCPNLTNAPSRFPCLKKLYIDEMDSPSPLANMCSSNLISLTKLVINGVDGLVCLPDMLFSNSQNLSRLSISGCPKLTHLVFSLQGGGASLRWLEVRKCSNFRELPDDLHSLSLLEQLEIIDCPNLKSIPYPSGGQSHEGFSSLRQLTIYRCEGLTNLPTGMMESCVLSLEKLELNGLRSLTNLPMVICCLQKMPWLTALGIVDVPKFTDFPVEIGSLGRLRVLQLGASSSDALDYRLVREFLNDCFKGLSSLHVLKLWGMEHWDSLPDQLQQLAALTELDLFSFGIEALPEWLGNMSSLQQICVWNCKKLRRLPTKEAMQRLTKLANLIILDCPLLNVQRCNGQQSADSQWPNISHIPNVEVWPH